MNDKWQRYAAIATILATIIAAIELIPIFGNWLGISVNQSLKEPTPIPITGTMISSSAQPEGLDPTSTPTPVLIPTETPRPANTPQPSATPVKTLNPTNTPQPSATPTSTLLATNTPRPSPTPTSTLLATNTPRPSPTPTKMRPATTASPTEKPANLPKPSTDSIQPSSVSISKKISCTTAIQFGQEMECSLTIEGETRIHDFYADAGDSIYIQVAEISGDLNPSFSLVSSSGATVESNIDGESCMREGDSTVAGKTCRIDKSGRYFVHVYSYNKSDRGTYRLTIQRHNEPGYATNIVFGERLTASIETVAEDDYFTFDAQEDDVIYIKIIEISGSLNPSFILYDDSGETSKSEQFGEECLRKGDSSVAEKICQVSKTGRFILHSYSYNYSDRGKYQVSIQRLNAPGSTVPVTFGQVVDASIDIRAEDDYYTFAAQEGDVVYIELAEIRGNLNPSFSLFDNRGYLAELEEYGEQCYRQGDSTVAGKICRINRTGNHTIRAYSYNIDDKGIYRITVQRLNNPGLATPISFGQTVNGSIDTVSENDYYIFKANEGDWVTITVVELAGNLNPSFFLFNDEGAIAEFYEYGEQCYRQGDSSVAELSCRINNTGNYTIDVYSYNSSDVGNYAISLEKN